MTAPRPVVVLLYEGLPEAYVTAVRKVSPRIRVVLIGNDKPLPAEVAEATVLHRSWSLRHATVDAVLDTAPHLEWMHVPSAGVDVALRPKILERDFVITHMVGAYDRPVAEFALTLILAATKRLPSYFDAQREHRWAGVGSWDRVADQSALPAQLGGKTVGIIGFGGIGKALAAMVRPLKARVIALQRSPQADRRADLVYGPDRLPDLLAASDFVVLALPLTPQTERMIGGPEIERLKPTAWLINVARGRLIDDDALVSALRDGRIGGAALDVFSYEPLAADHPYWALPNVILTPHMAGAVQGVGELDQASFLAELRRFVARRPFKAVVPRSKGY